MKTTSIILSLLFLNSFVLVGQITTVISSFMNPYLLGGIELFLLVTLYAYRIIRDVRNVFDFSK